MTNRKRISICGSMTFINDMEVLGARLIDAGYEVNTPAREEVKLDWSSMPDEESLKLKRIYIDGYLEKIRNSDLVLIANYPKDGIAGYIGANALMEAAFAYALGIPVVYLKRPGNQSCRLEAHSISRVILNDDIQALDAVIR